jgi:hypothetical protein
MNRIIGEAGLSRCRCANRMRSTSDSSNPRDPKPARERRPGQISGPDSVRIVPLLRRWLEAAPAAILERPPRAGDEAPLRRQLAAFAAGGAGGRQGITRASRDQETGDPDLSALVAAALGLWQALSIILDREMDLYAEDTEALSMLAAEMDESSAGELSPRAAVGLIREFLAADGGMRLTPERFGRRLARQPPTQLELPDRVALSGASLAAFLESAHFPFGQYRAGEEWFFVTPSLRLGASALEAMIRSGPGCRRVGQELLVWQPASFRVAAGTAADDRHARPFVGPTGARAYLWLGPVLPGGPLVLRDANNAEMRVAVPEEAFRRSGVQANSVVRSAYPAKSTAGLPLSDTEYGIRTTPEHLNARAPERLTPHPALRRAEEALQRGEDHGAIERCLREVMKSPGAGGAALAGAGRLWQAVGRPEVARAAFTMALERGSVEGALGLSRLAESMGEGLEAAARPLDAAIARNLRSAELHARYAELLACSGWDQSPLVNWHRRQAEELG